WSDKEPMASTLDEDNYPDPLVSRGRGSGLWRVVALAAVLIAGAVAFAFFGDRIPADVVMTLVGLFAVVGVFCLFALASGLFRFGNGEEGRTLSRAIVD